MSCLTIATNVSTKMMTPTSSSNCEGMMTSTPSSDCEGIIISVNFIDNYASTCIKCVRSYTYVLSIVC